MSDKNTKKTPEELAKTESTGTETVTSGEAPAGTSVTPDLKLEEFLKKYGGGSTENLYALSELGVESVDDLADLTAEELVKTGLKLVQARKLLKELKGEGKAPEAAPKISTPAPIASINMDSVLPAVPDDGSWLASLKSGGILKVSDTTYLSAIRAALASRCGLYAVSDKLLKKLEDHAKSLDEPVGSDYYQIRKMIARRSYAEIFETIEGIDGNFATKERRNEFLASLDDILWPAIKKAWNDLDAWYESARALMSDPGAFVAALNGQNLGGLGLTMPPFDNINSACDNLKDDINKVFRGAALPVSAALAYDAHKINEVLANSALPAQIGASNRDQMLKMLDLNINSSYVRQEQCIIRFVLSFIKFNDDAIGSETQYLNALWQLGRQIDWESLGLSSSRHGAKSISGNQVL
ncbi:MAG: hypothetical protein Q4B65_00190 [Candidatus Saccharibacteria bacterium]|nr:hypothetical protein [Candidatus Saccharibacteria bacterium]